MIPDKSKVALECEAAMLAVNDAGLDLRQIDGLRVFNDGGGSDNPRYHIYLSEVLGL